ncbi:MAG TPA: mechanosensitive ion channel domain-containing protein [Woeseiaceae bacterium]
MDDLITKVIGAGRLVLEYVYRPAFISQAIIIVVLFVLAYGLAWWAAPRLETRAREIRGWPAVLRLIAILLRRLVWIVYVAFLTMAYVLVQSIGWPAASELLSTVLLLALAWLVISVVSQAIRSRMLGRVFAVAGWIYVAATILGITDNFAAVLYSVGFQITPQFRLSLLLLLKAVLLLGLLFWLAFAIGNFLDQRIQRSIELTPSLRVLTGKIVRITLIIVAAILWLSGLGLNLTVFTVLSGAIGVGIGFGLQKVVSNLFSGIIILLDRSIKPGDTISVGETFGWIRELRARFVSVVTRDGREYLIPNEDFITHEVINWSYSDDLVRIDVPFGASYDADPHKVSVVAIEAASTVPRVVAAQKPVCWLTAFGDSSLEFLLRFWIRDPQNGLTNVRGAVLLAVWDAFKANGIGIPYPHREVIMKTPVEITGGPGVKPA